MRVLAQKKIKIQNKADLTGNSAPMLASFPVKSALFCILIFFSARTLIIYVCGGIWVKIIIKNSAPMGVSFFRQPNFR